MPTALVVLAAGQGTRMNSDLPKMLHRVGNRPLFAHALSAGRASGADRTVLVVGHGADQVRKAALEFDPDVAIVVQEEQRGTGHAAGTAGPALEGFEGDVVVLFGDTPLIRPETLARVAEARKDFDIVVLGFTPADPARYGRLVMEGDKLMRIVEFKDATEEERQNDFCNSGILSADAGTLFRLIAGLDDNNAGGELYLTDVVGLAVAQGMTATAIGCDADETLGVNSRADLAVAEAAFQARARAEALAREAGAGEIETRVARDIRQAEVEGRRSFIDATVTATATGRPRATA